MKGWPGVDELLKAAHPAQRPEIERAAAQLGRARSVLPAPLAYTQRESTARVSAPSSHIPSIAGPVMNKTERRYEQRLVAEGHAPRFAAVTLCLTSVEVRRVRYTPDFFVVRNGVPELHEVKGAYVYPDAALKFKFALEEWGEVYTFVWSQWAKGEWSIRRYERRNQEVR